MIPVVDPSKSSKKHHKSSIDFHRSCAKLRYAPQVHRGRDRNLIPPSLGPRAWPALVVHVFKRVLGGLERRDHGMIFVGHGQVLESDLHRLRPGNNHGISESPKGLDLNFNMRILTTKIQQRMGISQRKMDSRCRKTSQTLAMSMKKTDSGLMVKPWQLMSAPDEQNLVASLGLARAHIEVSWDRGTTKSSILAFFSMNQTIQLLG